MRVARSYGYKPKKKTIRDDPPGSSTVNHRSPDWSFETVQRDWRCEFSGTCPADGIPLKAVISPFKTSLKPPSNHWDTGDEWYVYIYNYMGISMGISLR